MGPVFANAVTRARRSMGRYSGLVKSGFAQGASYRESTEVLSSGLSPEKDNSSLLVRLWSEILKTPTVKSRLCRKIER
jgi:hypothetical protein